MKLNVTPKNILIINQFGIGDVIFTLPIVRNVRHYYPGVKIGYLCNSRVAPMLRDSNCVDKIFIYDRDEYREISKRSKLDAIKKTLGFIGEIKRERYDMVFDLSLNMTFNVLTLIAGIKKRIGLNYKNRSPFLTDKLELKGFEGRHVVEFYIELLKKVGLYADACDLGLKTSNSDEKWAGDLLKDNGFNVDIPVIGVMPGAGASWGTESKYRRWPIEKYEKLVDKIIENLHAQIILMGDVKEVGLCEMLAKKQGSKILQVCGRTSLGQLSSLLKRCDVVVVNDGGPLHLSVSVGTKTVSIFGPVDPDVYGPYGDRERHVVIRPDVACSPCYRRFRMVKCEHITCLNRIRVEDVFTSVEKLLEERK